MYRKAGFLITTADNPAVKIVKSLTLIPQNNSNNQVTLTAAKLFGGTGTAVSTENKPITNYEATNDDYIAYYKDAEDGYLKSGDAITSITQYWITPDEVRVTGTTQRAVDFNRKDNGLITDGSIKFTDTNGIAIQMTDVSGSE